METRSIGETVTPKKYPALKSKIYKISVDWDDGPLYVTEGGGVWSDSELEPKEPTA